ncbi:hypothetical protein J4E91_002886 [Alternaria rosae]|nr:hypothetical protein J4E91_002886 [Alternaria rosae]
MFWFYEQYCTTGATGKIAESLIQNTITEKAVNVLDELIDPECGHKSEYEVLRLGELGHPKIMPYPVGKRRTKENMETIQATERRLDELWSKFNAYIQKYLHKEDFDTLGKLAPGRGEMQWMPHWVEPAELSNQAKIDAALEEYIMPMIPGQQRDTMDLPIRSEKPKTRGKTNGPSAGPVEVEADLQAVVPEETNTPSTPRFTVGKTTQHTFSTIFFQPSASSHPGEVPWTEFLSTMNTIGFSPEKVYGSV